MTAQSIKNHIDRDAIRALMDRYCLSLFRADASQLLSIYWPGAQEEHGDYSGPVEGFVERFAPALRARVSTVASIRYQEISFVSETEAKAAGFGHITVLTGNGEETTTALLATRYEDTVEKRGIEWRIRQRRAALIFKREI
ncbi:nuclear transport factor 2 family protein [Bradyrhizobium sp. Arg314]